MPSSLALAGRQLPEQDVELANAALLGVLVEGLIGPQAPEAAGRGRELVQSLTLIALRALGVADARARGLVISYPASGVGDQAQS